MERTTHLNNYIANTKLEEANGAFNNATTLHTAVDVLDSNPSPGKLLTEGSLRISEGATTWLLERRAACHAIERESQETKVLE